MVLILLFLCIILCLLFNTKSNIDDEFLYIIKKQSLLMSIAVFEIFISFIPETFFIIFSNNYKHDITIN